jgi:hypothetical protein
MTVQLKHAHPDYPDVTADQPYGVIGIEADGLRLLNDQGRPYLYPRELFTVLDAREPGDWIVETGAEGERYAYPPSLNTPGFFEDFFDGDEETEAIFWRVVNRRLALAAEAL